MNTRTRTIALLIAVAFATTACETTGVKKEDIGTGIGAVAGAVVGNAFGQGSSKTGRALATLIGGAAGAMIGKSIGASLDAEDQKRLALETGKVLDNSSTLLTSTTGDTTYRQESFIGARGQMVEVFESDAAGKPIAVVKTAYKRTTPKKAPAKKTVKQASQASQAQPAAPAMAPAAPPMAPAPAGFIRASIDMPAPAVGDCKYVTQRVALPDGSVTTEPAKYCRHPAPAGWKRIEA